MFSEHISGDNNTVFSRSFDCQPRATAGRQLDDRVGLGT